jgi:hypothetical protein
VRICSGWQRVVFLVSSQPLAAWTLAGRRLAALADTVDTIFQHRPMTDGIANTVMWGGTPGWPVMINVACSTAQLCGSVACLQPVLLRTTCDGHVARGVVVAQAVVLCYCPLRLSVLHVSLCASM